MNRANDNRIRLAATSMTLLSMLCSQTVAATENSLEQLLFSDWEQRVIEVNEGELHVFAQPLEQPVHLHSNHITITPDSLQTGWVLLQQCHQNLDAVADLQIRFTSGRTRELEVTEAQGIESARVEGDSVQLRNISKHSRLCLRLQTLALHQTDEGVELVTGPYMRRFLDGFYPMQVQLTVTYPQQRLQFQQATPLPFKQEAENRLRLNVWFEGRLTTRLRFVRRPGQ